MKLLKLFPVALAAFALASCSTEDFESSKTQDLANKGDLRIVWDTVDGNEETRSLSDNKFNGPFFEAGDQIFVYDNLMHSTDVYAFQENAFYFDPQFEGDAPIIQGNEVAYAVYPGKYWDFTEEEEVVKAPKGYVLRTEVGTPTCVDIKIPRVLRYKEIAGQYGYEIPFFGAASYHGTPGAEGTYIQADNFRALTARLRIKLDNAFGNVSYLKLSNTAGKPLSGTLTAKLYTGDDRTKSMLQVVDKDYTVFPEIYIDLRNVPSNLSYIYIPVVCGPDYDNLLNGDTDGITLEYSNDRTVEDPTTIGSWTDTGMKFPGEVFSPNSRHAGKHTFTLTGMNPKKISDLLSQYKESTSDITLNLKHDFTIKAGDATIDNVVYLPEFKKEDMTVTITLDETFAWAGSLTNTAHDALVVRNAEGVEATNAKVILDLGPITPDAGDLNLTIDAPGADVQVIGDFSGQTSLELLNAKKVTIGAAGKATKWTNTALAVNWGAANEGVKEIEIAKDAEVTVTAPVVLGNNANSTITEKLTVNGKLTATNQNLMIGGENMKQFIVGDNGEVALGTGYVSGYYGKQLEKIEIAGPVTTVAVLGATDFNTDVIVKGDNGKVTGNVTVYNVASNVTVEGKGQVDGSINAAQAGHEVKAGVITITSETDKAVTGNVSTMGNVNIAMTAEGEAIAGTLNMKGANKTLNLAQGYINEISVNVGNTGTWETNQITIDLDGFAVSGTTYQPGLIAFKKLSVAKDNSYNITESKWDGNVITNATYKGSRTEVWYNGAAITGSNFVFTASQLAYNGTGAANWVCLANDIDLQGQQGGKGRDKWNGFDLSGQFMGKSKILANGTYTNEKRTIKNLDLQNTKGHGLINKNEATQLQNLIIDGVTGVKGIAHDNLGALISENNAEATIKDVEVKAINILAGTGAHNNYGGVVGKSTKKLTFNNVKVAGTIDAYSCIGGFVGTTSAEVIASNCDATGIAFKQSYDSGKTYDLAYAKVGAFIGNVTGNANVTITSGTVPASINFDKASKMFCADQTVTDGDLYTYSVNPNQKYVGFSGNANTSSNWTIGTLTVDGKAVYTKLAFTNANANSDSYVDGTVTKYPIYKWAKKTISARQQR